MAQYLQSLRVFISMEAVLHIQRTQSIDAQITKEGIRSTIDIALGLPRYTKMNTDAVGLLEQLNNFPHIVDKMRLYWGAPECLTYIDSLLLADKIGRQGFPMSAFMAVHKLRELHCDTFPLFDDRRKTPFTFK